MNSWTAWVALSNAVTFHDPHGKNAKTNSTNNKLNVNTNGQILWLPVTFAGTIITSSSINAALFGFLPFLAGFFLAGAFLAGAFLAGAFLATTFSSFLTSFTSFLVSFVFFLNPTYINTMNITNATETNKIIHLTPISKSTSNANDEVRILVLFGAYVLPIIPAIAPPTVTNAAVILSYPINRIIAIINGTNIAIPNWIPHTDTSNAIITTKIDNAIFSFPSNIFTILSKNKRYAGILYKIP